MLTDVEASAAKAAERDYKLADSNGLYLFVTRSGFKSWRMKYRFDGKEKRLTFGAYPEVTLEEARARRDDARRMLREQMDPAAERQRARLEGMTVPTLLPLAATVDPDVAATIAPAPAVDAAPVSVDPAPHPLAPERIAAPHAQMASPIPPAAPPIVEPGIARPLPIEADRAAGSRALALLREAEVAAATATRQASLARRIAYAVIAVLLIAAVLVAWWLIRGTRTDGARQAAIATAPVPAVVAQPVPSPVVVAQAPATVAAATPTAIPPSPVVAVPRADAATPPRRAAEIEPRRSAIAANRPASARRASPVLQAAAPPPSASAARSARTVTASPTDPAPAAAPRSNPLSPSSQEKAYAVPSAPGATDPVDPALDRAGRFALCLRAAYYADASCIALRGAGG